MKSCFWYSFGGVQQTQDIGFAQFGAVLAVEFVTRTILESQAPIGIDFGSIAARLFFGDRRQVVGPLLVCLRLFARGAFRAEEMPS